MCFAPAMLLLAVSAHAGLPEGNQANKKEMKEMVVVIDPGHGGPSLGARGTAALEKEIVLKVAKKLGVLIVSRHPDIELLYTRTTDTIITLEDRGTMANKAGANLFISIHANSSPKKTPYGTETYVMGLDKTDKNMDVALYENAEIRLEANYETKYEGYDPNSPESFIMFSFMQNTNMEQSLTFAAYVEDEFTKHAKRKSRGVKQGPFLVLWKTTMPSVLIEIGFISNTEEEKYITSDKGQTEIAEAILQALSRYKERWEKGGLATPQADMGGSNANNTGHNNKSVKSKPAVAFSRTPQKPQATYHIQIFSTSTQLKANAQEFKGLKNVRCYGQNGTYRYCIGSADSAKELMPLLKEVRKKFHDAFIVKLRNGKADE
ncbi:MAG: N-acetylmuramoyl-L-alanine amidase [Prevotellaceae bacterium]|nr:N-acetylmuramoyl-L-alanine amidase [Prevotellaceae bacterium]